MPHQFLSDLQVKQEHRQCNRTTMTLLAHFVKFVIQITNLLLNVSLTILLSFLCHVKIAQKKKQMS